MYETKADPLEASFDVIAANEAMGELRAEMAALRERMDQAAVIAGRPALSGARAGGESGAKAFVEQYLRKGVEGGIEFKSFSGATSGDGGYAVPREIDDTIDRALTAISPIRSIANVVKVGTSGYRKLVTTGGTPSGWVAETDARPETATPTFREIVPPFGELYANPAASHPRHHPISARRRCRGAAGAPPPSRSAPPGPPGPHRARRRHRPHRPAPRPRIPPRS